MKIKKGDRVVVVAGRDRGATGLVIAADPDSKRPARVGYRVDEDGTKVRVARPSGKEI
jgi:large subunit ribosomal protein L24